MNIAIYRMAIVALLAAVSVLSMRSCASKKQKLDQVQQVVQLQHDTIIRWRDAAGRQHAKTGLQIADVEILKALHRQEMDSLLTILKIKEKQLHTTVFAGTQTTGTITPKIDTVYLDGNPTYSLSYKDAWLSLNGELNAASKLQYSYTDSLVFALTKTKGYFNINAYSLNPNTRFTGLTSLQIPMPARRRFGIGPYVGYGYTGQRWQPSFGLSFHYSLIQF